MDEQKKEKIKEIYLNNVDSIYKYFYVRVLSVEVAQDLTSHTFHKFILNLEKIDEKKGELKGYLFTIAKNTLFDFYRKKKEILIDDEILEKHSDGNNYIEKNVVNSRNSKILKEITLELDDIEQQVLHLRYTMEYSYVEIATELSISVNKVGVLLHRTIKKLENKINKKGLINNIQI